MNFLHISDTIQSSKDAFRHDTTVDRLKLWYEVLSQSLGTSPSSQTPVEFVGSEFGNSFQSGAQAIAILQERKYETSQLLLVNNASRAKHRDSKNAKGSECLWAQVEIAGVTHHIVGVDDESFLFISHFLKKGTKIQKIHSINYQDSQKGVFIDIEDLSQGTQFRSKEHFPLVQLLLAKHLQEHSGKVQESQLREVFSFEEHSLHLPANYVQIYTQKLLRLLGEQTSGEKDISSLVEAYVESVKQQTETLIREGGTSPDYRKTYLPGFAGIEKVQLLGELALLREKFGIYTQHTPSQLGIEQGVLNTYARARQTLAENQLLLIDRDRFGNAIFSYSPKFNGIHSYVGKNAKNGCNFSTKNDMHPISISGGGVEFSAVFTQTISDLTGENCIWESSSRGPSGEKFLNINTSIGEDGKILEEVQGLPIGTVLTLTLKHN